VDGGSNGAISGSNKSNGRHLVKISNGHISATGRPIHFMFDYRVGFSGMMDLWRYFRFEQNQDDRRHHLG